MNKNNNHITVLTIIILIYMLFSSHACRPKILNPDDGSNSLGISNSSSSSSFSCTSIGKIDCPEIFTNYLAGDYSVNESNIFLVNFNFRIGTNSSHIGPPIEYGGCVNIVICYGLIDIFSQSIEYSLNFISSNGVTNNLIINTNSTNFSWALSPNITSNLESVEINHVSTTFGSHYNYLLINSPLDKN